MRAVPCVRGADQPISAVSPSLMRSRSGAVLSASDVGSRDGGSLQNAASRSVRWEYRRTILLLCTAIPSAGLVPTSRGACERG